MDYPGMKELKKLPKETLIELIKMYSKNWLTLDGLWFTGVEEKYGLDGAMELDIRMWQISSKIEAKRIKELFKLRGGIKDVLRAIDLMTWAGNFGYEYDLLDNRAVWTCRHCPPQEQRAKSKDGKGRVSMQTHICRLFQQCGPSNRSKHKCRMHILSSRAPS